MMQNDDLDKCCGTCAHFCEPWADGTGLCDVCHMAVTHESNGQKCRGWRSKWDDPGDDEDD